LRASTLRPSRVESADVAGGGPPRALVRRLVGFAIDHLAVVGILRGRVLSHSGVLEIAMVRVPLPPHAADQDEQDPRPLKVLFAPPLSDDDAERFPTSRESGRRGARILFADENLVRSPEILFATRKSCSGGLLVP